IKVGHPILAFEHGRRKIVAQTEVQSQLGSYLPVILSKTREHPQPLVHEEHVGKLRALHQAQKAIGIREARLGTREGRVVGALGGVAGQGSALAKNTCKTKVAAGSRLILEDIAHGSIEVEAQLERMLVE